MSGWAPHQFSLRRLSPSMSQFQLQATFWTRAAAFPVTEGGIPMEFLQQTSKYGRPQNARSGTKNKPLHRGPAEWRADAATLRCRCCLRAAEEDVVHRRNTCYTMGCLPADLLQRHLTTTDRNNSVCSESPVDDVFLLVC